MPRWKNKEEYEKWKAERAATGAKEKAINPVEQPALPSSPQNKDKYSIIQKKFGQKELIGFIGVGFILIGIFLPFIKIPIIGNMNYFRNGEGDGVILLILAMGSLVFILLNKMKWLWLTGIGSTLTLLFTCYNLQTKMHEIKEGMDKSLAGNPFRGIADTMVESIQMEVGIPVLIIGILLIIMSAYLNSKQVKLIN